MDNNSPQNGNSFDAENQENNNENKKIGVRPNLRLLQTPKLKIIFITLFIFVVLLLSIHINNNYGKFTKGPDLIYWKNTNCSLHKLKTGEILILGSNSHKSLKHSNMLYFIKSEIFNPKTNKFNFVYIDNNLFFLSSAIILNNGNILLTEVYPNRMAILNPATFKIERFINLHTKRYSGKFIIEISNEKICVLSKDTNKNKNLFEIYDLNTGSLVYSFDIPMINSGDIYYKPVYRLKDDNIFVVNSGNKNFLINPKNKSYEEFINPWTQRLFSSVQINDTDVLIFSEYGYGEDQTIITKFSLKNKSYEKIGIYKYRMNWHKTDASFTKVDENNVLICGGYKYLDPFKIFRTFSDEAYLFNNKSKKLHKLPKMIYPVAEHKTILLNDGRIFIVGGKDYSFQTQFFKINKRRK